VLDRKFIPGKSGISNRMLFAVFGSIFCVLVEILLHGANALA
jgi:hypothetical protein